MTKDLTIDESGRRNSAKGKQQEYTNCLGYAVNMQNIKGANGHFKMHVIHIRSTLMVSQTYLQY